MSDSAIPKKDADEAKRRAEWLHKHKAHKDWIILSVSEVAVIRNNLLILERERDEAREAYDTLATEHVLAVNKLAEERDDARKEFLITNDKMVEAECRVREIASVLERVKRERDEWAAMCGRYKQERDELLKEIKRLRIDAQREAEYHDSMVKELEGLYDKLKS